MQMQKHKNTNGLYKYYFPPAANIIWIQTSPLPSAKSSLVLES